MSGAEEKKPFQRLPTDAVPRNYRVELTPDLRDTFTFKGKLDITVEVVTPTRKVVLNCVDIEISSATIGGQEAKVTFQTENETVELEVASELAKGECVIHIEYTGTLNDQMQGFYRSKYSHPDHPEEERHAAVTQFEAADARRALPCWDEPAHKATFDVTLIVPKDRVALSNMNVVSTEETGDLKKVTFARTPIMSTYLLAFIVGEFDFVEAKDANGITIRVYTPTGKAEQGQFALDVAVKTLPFYTEYFGIPYPLPKMDLITIQDFAAGAMENWGLVTYRERLLLVDPVNTPALTKQIVAIIVGHELAHQWFGNLVTMEWWTHLWLNEGFATWIEYLCVDHTHPEYDIWTNFLSREHASAMSLDALANSHPIEVIVGPPSEVEEIFDAISYCKGACVIRMLHNWIGEDDFRKGLHNYLKKFEYKNASTDDLWAHLGEASGKPVAMVMSTWTKQMGYPVLSVEGRQDGNNRVLTVSQKKFCADGNIKGFESMQWKVPVTIATKQSCNALTFLLDTPTKEITIEGVGPDDWTLVNPGRKGYYRVSYSTDLFTPLLPTIKDSSLPPQDRLGLQNDAFALARAGVGNTVDVLRLFASYTHETNYTVWESLVSNLSSINRLLQNTDFHDNFKKFARGLFLPTVMRLGWDSKDTDTTLDTMLRSLVIGQVCHYGDADSIAEAKKRFDAHVSGATPIPPDLRGAVFSTCLANGDESTYDQLVKLHDTADSNDEKVRILRCLGAGKTEALHRRALEFSISDKVRPQDSWSPMFSVSSSTARARDMLWEFIQEKWTALTERFKGSFLLSRIVGIATSGFITEERALEIEKFFKEHSCPTADRTVKQNCEAIRLNGRWLQRDCQAIKDWLASQ